MKKITLTLIFLWLAMHLVPSYGAVEPKPVALSKMVEMTYKNSKSLIQLEIDQGLAIKKRNELAMQIELEFQKSEADLTELYLELKNQNAALEANERYYRSQKLALWTEVNSLYLQLLREGLSEQLESERLSTLTLQLPQLYNDYLSGLKSKQEYNHAEQELQETKKRMEQSGLVQMQAWKKLSALTGQKLSKESTLVISPSPYKFESPTATKLSGSALKADYEYYLSEKALEVALADVSSLMNAYLSAFGHEAAFMATYEKQSPVDYNLLFPLYKDFLAKQSSLLKPELPFVLPAAFKASEYPFIDALVVREKAKDRVKAAKTQVTLSLDLAVDQYTQNLKDYDLSLKTLETAQAEYKQLEKALMIGKINSSQMAAATYKKRNLVYDRDLKYLSLYESSAELAKLLGQF